MTSEKRIDLVLFIDRKDFELSVKSHYRDFIIILPFAQEVLFCIIALC